MLDGGGYPALHYSRECTLASRLVHVCDVFDALSTTRPYSEAWPRERALAYLRVRAGREFDPEIVGVFAAMMRDGAAQVRVLHDERRVVSPAITPPAPSPSPA
jgi:HD-GYP domain-containing protein (c-di-GMP phosphodiesterase class II)